MRREPEPFRCLLSRVALLAAATFVGCTDRQESRLPVVAVSVAPQAYFVERIAGDLVEVVVMIPPGANPATYSPTVHQVQAVTGAALYLKVGHPGFPFERTWLDSMLSVESGIVVVDGSVGAACAADDPHPWVAPGGVRAMATNLTEALGRLLPNHVLELQSNLESLRGEIDELDREVREVLSGYAGRRFLVFHPSWGCFAEEYGLQQVAIEHEGKEPSPRELSDLIRSARDDGIRVVFVQPQSSTRAASTIADAIGGRVAALDPLARDWPQNLRQVAKTLRAAFDADSSPGD